MRKILELRESLLNWIESLDTKYNWLIVPYLILELLRVSFLVVVIYFIYYYIKKMVLWI